MYSVHLLQSEIRIVTIVRILYAEVAPSQLHMAVDNCIKKKKSYHVDDLSKKQMFFINVPCRKNTRWNSGFAWFILFSIWNLFHVEIALKGHALHSKIYLKIWQCILSEIFCAGSDINFWRSYFPINSIDRFHVTSSKF